MLRLPLKPLAFFAAASAFLGGACLTASAFIPVQAEPATVEQVDAVTDTLLRNASKQEVDDASAGGGSTPTSPPVAYDPSTPPEVSTPAYGEEFAVISFPTLGYDRVVVGGGRLVYEGEDTTAADMELFDSNEVVHFSETTNVGQVGNFVLGGHRDGVLGGFAALEDGAPVVVMTADGYFTYVVQSQQVIDPSQVEALNPVPFAAADASATERLMTLLTCFPDFGAGTDRRAVVLELQAWQPLEAGQPEALAG